MATANRVFTWTSDAEGWSFSPGNVNVTGSRDAAYGNPAGSLYFNAGPFRNIPSNTSTYEIVGTWAALFGIPTSATVTNITFNSGNRRCTVFTGIITTCTIGPIELYDNVPNLRETLLSSYAYSGLSSAWDNWGAGSVRSVPTAIQAATSTIRLRVSFTVRTGNNPNSTVKVYFDNLSFTITHSAAQVRNLSGTAALSSSSSTVAPNLTKALTGTAASATTVSTPASTVLRKLTGTATLAASTPALTLTLFSNTYGIGLKYGAGVLYGGSFVPGNIYNLTGTAALAAASGAPALDVLRYITGTAGAGVVTSSIIADALKYLTGTAPAVTATPAITMGIGGKVIYGAGYKYGAGWLYGGSVGLIVHQIAGTAAMSAVTPSYVLNVLRPLTGTAALAASTPTISALLLKVLAGTISMDTVTPDISVVTGATLFGTAAAVTEASAISADVKRDMVGTAEVAAAVGSLVLNVRRLVTGIGALSTGTSDAGLSLAKDVVSTAVLSAATSSVAVDLLKDLLGTTNLVTLTNDLVDLFLRPSAVDLFGTAAVATGTPATVLNVLRDLASDVDLFSLASPSIVLDVLIDLVSQVSVSTQTPTTLLDVIRAVTGIVEGKTATSSIALPLLKDLICTAHLETLVGLIILRTGITGYQEDYSIDNLLPVSSTPVVRDNWRRLLPTHVKAVIR